MNIVLAPDAYKGSLSQVEVARLMRDVIKPAYPWAQLSLKPMADGGEGSLDALLLATDEGRRLPLQVTGPLGRRIASSIGIIQGDRVVIEMASIAGLPLVPDGKRNPLKTTSYGVGEAIKLALDQDYRKFLLCLGGSATNDGGLGLLQALGARIELKHGPAPVPILGEALFDITSINLDGIDQRIWECDIDIASDVNSPLAGPHGASQVFGPQKGLLAGQIAAVDQAMLSYARRLETSNSIDRSFIEEAGAGSAGGLGFALLHLGGKLRAGAKIIAQRINLEQAIAQAQVVITGEGKSDWQTLQGKAPFHVAELARAYHVPCLLVSGSLEAVEALNRHFTASYALVDGSTSLEQALGQPRLYLRKKMTEVVKDLEDLSFYRGK